MDVQLEMVLEKCEVMSTFCVVAAGTDLLVDQFFGVYYAISGMLGLQTHLGRFFFM